MKTVKRLTVLVGLLSFACASAAVSAQKSAEPAQPTLSPNFSNLADQTSYALGMTLGKNMKREKLAIAQAQFVKGFNDGYSGNKPLLSAEEVKASMMAFQKQMMEKAVAKHKAIADENLAKGQKFLDDNKSKTGIVSLPDGLQYKVIKSGMGNTPDKNDTVTVDYRASTIDGKVFDSSYKRGKPAKFKVSNMIRGFQEALLLMKAGSTWEVYIPSQLAYSQHGVPGVIGPNQALIFKIHLIAINNKNSK